MRVLFPHAAVAALLVLGCSSDEAGGGGAGTGGDTGGDGGGAGGSTADAAASGGTGGLPGSGGSTPDGSASGGTGGTSDGGTETGAGGTPDAGPCIPDPLPPSTATTGEFLALTYNVAGLPEALSGSPDPLTRMPLISPLLNAYDLVLVQEDWETPDPNPVAPTRVYHELLDDFVTHPFRSISVPVPLGQDPDRATALVSDGLNEFSNLYFDRCAVEHVRWTECYGDANVGAGDCLATKGFTLTVHTLADGVELHVYNLHGEAGRTAEDLRLMQQGFEVELSAFVVARSTGHAVILGGDTNLHTDRTPDGGIWDTFKTATGMIDVCDTIACGADADQIDKFAYRSSATLQIEPLTHAFERATFSYAAGPLSDHDPLAVRFRWTRVP